MNLQPRLRVWCVNRPKKRISLRQICVLSQTAGWLAGLCLQFEALTPLENAMQLTPLIAVHATAAVAAIVTGPIALWARKGSTQRPRLHRAFGYAWVTLMLIAATSAIFISGDRLPHFHGFGPIHLLIPVVFGMLVLAFWFLAKKNIEGHQKTMRYLYAGACVVAGSFTLMPHRLLGQLVWHQWLALV
jgi:uncharacterized membrane protein